ncbi:MAG: Maf family protein [Roseiarcus sp.]|uniref:Maf family protein n=1 Tax=Roseiarcus sp. TaxID=1969460 RepID=UPI003C393FF4
MGEAGISAPTAAQSPSLWRAAEPLILASKSPSRRALLSAVGLDAEVIAAQVDERALEDRHLARGGSLESLSGELAQAKALAVSAVRPHAYSLGADQTLTLKGRIFHKARDFDEARRSLAALSGKTHRLTSAFCVAHGGQALVVDGDHADLRMRPLDPVTISRYLERAGPAALASVGGYQVEGLGAHLMDRIEGEHSVVLGLPMLRLLAWLRRESLISL